MCVFEASCAITKGHWIGEKFKNLGTWVTSDGRCITDIENKIGKTKSAFYQILQRIPATGGQKRGSCMLYRTSFHI